MYEKERTGGFREGVKENVHNTANEIMSSVFVSGNEKGKKLYKRIRTKVEHNGDGVRENEQYNVRREGNNRERVRKAEKRENLVRNEENINHLS